MNALITIATFEYPSGAYVIKNKLESEIPKKSKIYCPSCNSTNVRKSDKPSSIVGLSYFLFLIPLPIYKKEHHCFECYNGFKIIFKNLIL